MAETTRSAPTTNSSGMNFRDRRPKSPIPGNYGGRTCIPLEDLDAFLADLEDEEESDSSLPRESQWYHGRLDRYTSEQRLMQAGKHGSYLVRESDRKPGSYVLSFLGKTGINHFRITAVCGDFYIGICHSEIKEEKKQVFGPGGHLWKIKKGSESERECLRCRALEGPEQQLAALIYGKQG